MLYFYQYWWILLPAIALSAYAQWKVKSTYYKYSQIKNKKNLTGADTAKYILKAYNIENIPVEEIGGTLTDHYDPTNKTLRLSTNVYRGTDVAALGIAAHEVGHAIQHNKRYSPLTIRNAMFPISSLGSSLGPILVLIGIFIGSLGSLSEIFVLGGIVLFSFAVLFSVCTLPVEFNASARAIKILSQGGFLDGEELVGAKKVLQAAALTYIAAALSAILSLVRLILMSQRRR